MSGEIIGQLGDIDDFRFFSKFLHLDGIFMKIRKDLPFSPHKFCEPGILLGKSTHGKADGASVCHTDIHHLMIHHIVVAVVNTSAIRSVLDCLPHTFRGRMQRQYVAGPAGISPLHSGLFIGQINLLRVKRTFRLCRASIHTAKSRSFRRHLRLEQISASKR